MNEVLRVLLVALVIVVVIALAFNDPGRYYQAQLEADRLAKSAADASLAAFLQTRNPQFAKDAAARFVTASGGTLTAFEASGKRVRLTISYPVRSTILVQRLAPLARFATVTATAEASQEN